MSFGAAARLSLVSVIVLLPTVVTAQPVPAGVSASVTSQAPAAPAPPPPPPRREGTAEFAFVGNTGNSSSQTIGLSGDFIYRPDTWVIRNRAAFIRNESDDELTAESFLYLFRAEKALSARLSAFGEYGYFRDEFAGVDHRNAVTGGVSYKVVDLPAHQFFVDGGLGYLNEQRLAGDDVSSATYSGGGGYKWKISPTAEFTEDARFTGTFAEAEDWRFLNVVALTTRINALFSLKISNTIRYAHMPVEGYGTTDTSTAVALVAKF